jgi:hypothetical protein
VYETSRKVSWVNCCSDRQFDLAFKSNAWTNLEMLRPDCSEYEHNEVPYAPFREAHVTEEELSSLSWYDAGTRVTDAVLSARQC